ncbi:DUF308 domain-containing protein [Leucobacter denitrificans]|uniref:DUF308 domain-containing protein n=1 Tax=Leucobacter denitrificans TaxID=683042 RepID=A0A7G9S2Y1_9MICO|nr:DUF308 domain-containing protein [Leucobacter denitrificans]QNN62206.1 DUF308 domain-containing protein [Leucobacter denitrificans]
MSSSVRGKRAVDPSLLAPRWVRLLRAIVLCVFGFAITFSATLHEDLGFDVAIVSSALVVIGAVHIIEWTKRRGKPGAPVALLLGVVSIVAGILVFTIRLELGLAVVIAAWALICGLLEFVGITVVPGTRSEGALVGFAGLVLALAVLIVREDLVAVVGFFGGYAVLTGVFLGIAAFDPRHSRASSGARQQLSNASVDPKRASDDSVF